MSDARPLNEQWFHRIKAATRDLVKICGGVVRAGEVANRSKTEVSRWQSAGDSDVIDLAAALALEADCGVPVVTTVMAEVNGRRLTDEVAAQSAASLLDRHSEVLRRSAETCVLVAQALADHTVTPAEAELIDRSLAEQEVSLRHMRAGLASVKGAGAVNASAPMNAAQMNLRAV
ncbi:hypothetical protein V5G24_23280 [Xanthobacter sp. VTT E-85241]|uniref:hypothetical protein n=1 Tax=Roseixanthobacter finlandensis TaxID=3119922 RepID=UPI00372A286B